MRHDSFTICLAVTVGLAAFHAAPVRAMPPETLHSVVSVLPVWPGRPQGGTDGTPRGNVPEGSGVVVAGAGLIATAWHVVKPARRIDVRLADGRILPARLVGHDAASDIALLRVDSTLPAVTLAPEPELAAPVCAIGNAYGLGLSVACGVISALHVAAAGFNAVEDFVQTDAAANPGSSGGALVDSEGRLVGMVSAIFASGADTNIGVNFAVSAALLDRVVDDLSDDGMVEYVSPGWRLMRLSRAELAETAGARVADLAPDGPAARAGVEMGDIVIAFGERPVRGPRDAIGALALVRPGGEAGVTFLRDGERREVSLSFTQEEPEAEAEPAQSARPDCPHPEPVCDVRRAVFPVSSFDPVASGVRIGPGLIVTNRHVVGDRSEATVFTPGGPKTGRVVASAYRGDLALLEVDGLPEDGLVLAPSGDATLEDGPYFAVGADVGRQEVRVFTPGGLILPPADGAELGRIHVTAFMQPGVSGGALVDDEGRLKGIAAGGGEGRYEALPIGDVNDLLALRDDPQADAIHAELGGALVRCVTAVETASTNPRGQPLGDDLMAALAGDCRASENIGQFLEAGRLLAFAGAFDEAAAILEAAVDQVPHSINARLSLLVSLQLGGRFPQMLPHARWLFEVASEDPQALRFAIQTGVWGGDPGLAEDAYAELLEADPRQAQAARRFIDQPPPAPRPR